MKNIKTEFYLVKDRAEALLEANINGLKVDILDGENFGLVKVEASNDFQIGMIMHKIFLAGLNSGGKGII